MLSGPGLGVLHARVVFAGVLAAVLCVPIPLGANRPLAWFAWETGVFALLALCSLGLAMGRQAPGLSTASFRILAVLTLWLAMVFAQTLPVPESLVSALNPLVHDLQKDLGLISVSTAPTLSIDPGNTYNELLKYGAYVAVFLMTLVTVTTRARLLTAAGVIIAAGVVESVFEIYSQTTGFIPFPESGAANELRTGTFVNRNHYANLLSMSLGLVFGLLTAVVNSQRRGAGVNIARYGDRDTALMLLLLATALLLVAGIFLSGSRAPIVFFTLSLATMLALGRSRNRDATGELVLLPLALLGCAVTIIAMGFDDSLVRLLDRDLFGGERMTQNLAGLKMLAAVWPTGVGAGNYQWMFPMFRGDDLRFVTYDHAHNDYLETVIELGIPAAAILCLGVLLMIREMLTGYRVRRNPVIRGVIFPRTCLPPTPIG
ncbi:MAG TPA: O-antigen ligase family protein [Halomonas sp.]|nr:O-antigen ligase family protein [Halomonas sp.]